MIKATRKQNIDTIFVLLIFSVFAVSVLIVLMLGASIYQNMSDITQENADERLALSYIWTKAKIFNDVDMIYIDYFNENKALFIEEEVGNRKFQTIIYFYDGWLYENFTLKDVNASISGGEPVLRVENLTFEELEHNLIRVNAGHLSVLINTLSYEKIIPLIN